MVYKAVKMEDHSKYAIKRIKIEEVTKSSSRSELFSNEVRITRKINHKNVIKLRKVIESSDYYYLVYDFCQKGAAPPNSRRSPQLHPRKAQHGSRRGHRDFLPEGADERLHGAPQAQRDAPRHQAPEHLLDQRQHDRDRRLRPGEVVEGHHRQHIGWVAQLTKARATRWTR